MKRLVYTGLLMFMLIASACQKQNIEPNPDTNREIPSWNCNDRGSEAGGGNRGASRDPGEPGKEDGIVDPNGEEEGSDKPGQHTEN